MQASGGSEQIGTSETKPLPVFEGDESLVGLNVSTHGTSSHAAASWLVEASSPFVAEGAADS